MSRDYNLSYSCMMNAEEKTKARAFAKTKVREQAVPDHVISSLITDLEKFDNWMQLLSERLYVSLTKIRNMKALNITNKEQRKEFVDKGIELLAELRLQH